MLALRQSFRHTIIYRLPCPITANQSKCNINMNGVTMRGAVVISRKEISSGVFQRMSSTVASKELSDDNKDEIIRYLTLNNLSDNPGAIKRVS